MSRAFHEGYGLDYTLTLTSPLAAQPVILNLMVIEFSMYEDMFGPFMRMELMINDAVGLIDKFPLVGDEELEFKYKNPNDIEFTQNFVVYKVSGRAQVRNRAQVYTLHAISKEGFNNTLESVYKPFIEMKTHEIVQDVFDNYLKKGKKNLISLNTSNKYTRVASGQNPLKLINEISLEAKSSQYEDPSSYIFWESADDFYWMPVGWFSSLKPNYNFQLQAPSKTTQYEASGPVPEHIREIKFLDSFDNIDQAHRGAYYNEVNVIDPILKRFAVHPLKEPDKKKFQFDYKKNWDDLKHLPNSGKKFVSEQGELGKAKKAYSTHRRMLLSQIEKDNEKYQTDSNKYFETMLPMEKGDQLNAPRMRHTFLSKTTHELTNMFTNVIEITTAGIAENYVGMLCTINIPQPSQMNGDAKKFLLLYGQKATFLVTAIRHHYDMANDMYTTVLSCSKESLGIEPKGEKIDIDGVS
jgi:hypothetical protein